MHSTARTDTTHRSHLPAAAVFIPLLLWCLLSPSRAGVGESAVITLVFPHGARGLGMGEVGVALADDEHVVYNNPAGLGVDNERWHTGALCWFYEPLLPAFGMHDLWHAQTAGIWQPPQADIGGFGIDYNYINMGVNQWFDELGHALGEARSWEHVLSLGWGADVFDTERHYLGGSVKWISSALAPGIGTGSDGIANSFACDFGYLRVGAHGVRIAAKAANMGPSVYYIDEASRDPIPFTLHGAVAYVNDFGVDNWTILSVAFETHLHREFVKNYPDKNPDPFYVALFTSATDDPLVEELSEIQVNWGGELRFLESVALRTGFLFDWVGCRFELTYGFGLRLFGHIEFDWANIYSPTGFLASTLSTIDPTHTGATGARHRQWRLSVALTDMLDWRPEDFIPFNIEKMPGFVKPPMPPR